MYQQIFVVANLDDVEIHSGYDEQTEINREAITASPQIERAWQVLERHQANERTQPPERKHRTLVSFIAALLS